MSSYMHSPISSVGGDYEAMVRPYPYIKNKIRRHVAKRPKMEYSYDKALKKNGERRAKRNKRLRQTYFAASFAQNHHSMDYTTIKSKKKEFMNAKLENYFSKRAPEEVDMKTENEV